TQRARAGYVTGGIVFGYDNVPVLSEGGKKSHVIRAVNEAQALVVRRIFALCADGTGYSRIAQQLNREGAAAPKPKRGRLAGWSHSTIRVVLHRRMYLGEGIYNRTEKRDVWGQNRLRRPPQSEWIRVAAPPIISEAEWRAAHDRIEGVRARLQAVGAAIGNRRPRDSESPYLLSGFARCEVCGSALGVLSGGRDRSRVYGCTRAHKTGLCPNRLRVNMNRVDSAVLNAVVDQVLTETVVEAIVERVLAKLAPPAVSRSVSELRTELKGVEREIANVTSAIAKGGELESLLDKLREGEKRRTELRRAIEARGRVQSQQVDRMALENAVRRRVDDWRGLLNRRPTYSRQLLREMLAGPITFTPNGRVYRFRGEASFGALTGEASGTPLMVPVRGFGRLCHALQGRTRPKAA
ncbi:MAG: recombinase family protein, partial [Vicinamibacterales bacterium]